jgi:hypothetical protein
MRTPEELAYGWRDALFGRDHVAFGNLFAADGVMLDVEHRTADGSGPRPLEGRAAIEAMAREWLAVVPEFEYDVLEVLADATRAAARWRYAVQGREFDGVSWLDCRDGEIVRALVLFDSYGLLAHGD